ncbi:MAG: polysaccharide biosynthesis tyrosine autokinase [Chitinophagaceae bacterium]|nr:MAG: polysaccharide biosynthesis tyrosine autokinase [Chitinophagaceae bacterium]
MEEPVSKNKSELWTLSIKDLFYKYLRYLPLILLCVLVAMGGAFLYLRYATQIYSANALMIIQNDQKQANTDKVEDILLGSNKTQNIQNEMEILRSRPLMERVVNKLDLSFSATQHGKIKDLNVYRQTPFAIRAISINDSTHVFRFVILYTDTDKLTVNGQPVSYNEAFKTSNGMFELSKTGNSAAGQEYEVTWSPVTNVAGSLVSSISILPKAANSGILNIAMLSSSPILARDVVNTLMKEYSLMNIEQNNFSTDQMLNFINSRLVILNKELDSAQQKLLVYQQENDLVDIDAQLSGYFQNVNEGDRAILTEQTRLGIADLIGKSLSSPENQYQGLVVPSSLGLEDPVLNEMVGRYNTVQLERKTLLESNTPAGNPAVKLAESQVENLRATILENIRNIKTSYEKTIGTLQRNTGKNQANLKDLPYKIKRFIELKKPVDIKLELVKQLEGKREETAIARSSTVSSSRVIQDADNGIPVKPNRTTVQIIALLIGLGLPAMFIFIKELLNDKVSSRNDIERITGAPVVGEVGHSFSDEVLVVTRTSRSMVAEQFRIIRSNLQYIIGKVEKPVIMATSSFSGEGKSFVSTNMGAAMAVTGKKTVILEFDIRKPKVLAGLKMTRSAGISNFLVGKEKLENLIVPVTGVENLYVLPCGPIPPNPAELLLDPQVDVMFAYLKEHYDVVIIDTAPVGMVSDAITLGKYADCTLYLVRQGYTYKKQIALIDELYTQKKLPAVSIVVNDVKMKSGYGYYGYGRYGYGYGYGNSYYEETAPVTFFQKLRRAIGLGKAPKTNK